MPDPIKQPRWDGVGNSKGPSRTVTHEIKESPCTFEIEMGGNLPPKTFSLSESVQNK